MNTETTVRFGRRAEDILENEAGGKEYRAMALAELAGQVECVAGEFVCDKTGVELVRLCGELDACLKGLFLTADGELTATMECDMCGGQGSYNRSANEPVTCEGCGGTGAAA